MNNGVSKESAVGNEIFIDQSERKDLTPVYMIAVNERYIDREFTREDLVSLGRAINEILYQDSVE